MHLFRICLALCIGSLSVFPLQGVGQQIDWKEIDDPDYGTVLSSVQLKSGPVFIGTEKNGVFKSVNGGDSWKDVSSWPLQNETVWDLAVKEGNVYGATRSGEIWFTEDRGQTWNKIGLPDSILTRKTAASQLAVDTTGAVYIGFGHSSKYIRRVRSGIDTYGIYKRKRNESWKKIDINPFEPDVVKNFYISPAGNIYATSNDLNMASLFISKNRGKDWYETQTFNVKPVEMASYNDKLYAVNPDGIVWTSTSQGSTFTQVVDMRKCADYKYPRSTYFNDMTITDDGAIYFTNEFFPSKRLSDANLNGYLSYYDLSSQKCKIISSNKVAFFNLVELKENILISSFFDGIFNYNKDKATVRNSSTGISGTSIQSLGVTANNNIVISSEKIYDKYRVYLAGGETTKTVTSRRSYILEKANNQWHDVGTSLIPSVEADPNKELTYFIKGGELFKSENILENMTQIKFYRDDDYYEDLSVVEKLSDRILVGSSFIKYWDKYPGRELDYGKIYASDTEGRIWYKAGASFAPITSMTSLDEEHLLATNDSATVIVSDNGGVDWVHRDMFEEVEDEGKSITDVEKVTADIAIASTNLGLFKTRDEGGSWEPVYRDTSGCKLVTDKFNNVYCYRADKVLVSSDSGSTWKETTNFFQGKTVRTFQKDTEGYIYAATASGIYKSASVHTDIDTDKHYVSNFSLQKAYPNPFNPTTTIEYTLPEATQVKLKIYNVVGKEVATLVNKIQRAGRYKVTFNASELSSGVYFYTIFAGDYKKTRKMMLIK